MKTDVNPDGNADTGTDTGTVDGGEHASNNKALSLFMTVIEGPGIAEEPARPDAALPAAAGTAAPRRHGR